MATANAIRLKIKVFTPFAIFYDGSGVSLSATNKTGPFDVLYGHASFFSILQPGEVSLDTGNEILKFIIDGGFVKVSDNIVTVFANV